MHVYSCSAFVILARSQGLPSGASNFLSKEKPAGLKNTVMAA